MFGNGIDLLKKEETKAAKEDLLLGVLIGTTVLILIAILAEIYRSKMDEKIKKKLEPVMRKYAEKIAISYQDYVSYIRNNSASFTRDVERTYKGVVVRDNLDSCISAPVSIAQFTQAVLNKLVQVVKSPNSKYASVTFTYCYIDYSSVDFHELLMDTLGNAERGDMLFNRWHNDIWSIYKKYTINDISIMEMNSDIDTLQVGIDVLLPLSSQDLKEMQAEIIKAKKEK